MFTGSLERLGVRRIRMETTRRGRVRPRIEVDVGGRGAGRGRDRGVYSHQPSWSRSSKRDSSKAKPPLARAPVRVKGIGNICRPSRSFVEPIGFPELSRAAEGPPSQNTRASSLVDVSMFSPNPPGCWRFHEV